MALLGTENGIKCPKCGCIDFEEKVIIQFHESLNLDKLKRDLTNGTRGSVRSRRYYYICKNCNTAIV